MLITALSVLMDFYGFELLLNLIGIPWGLYSIVGARISQERLLSQLAITVYLAQVISSGARRKHCARSLSNEGVLDKLMLANHDRNSASAVALVGHRAGQGQLVGLSATGSQ